MNARRRVLLAVTTAAAVAVAAGLALRADEPPRRPGPPPQDRPGPVLLVPGYGGATDPLQGLAGLLRRSGRDAVVVSLPGNGTGDLRDAAQALDAAAETALAAGAPSVDVVGYSAGGVVARYWVKELDGAEVARRVVTLGSPHHGTELASLGSAYAPERCPLACRQLVPGSDLLAQLNAGDETPDGPQWLAVWTAQDQVVTPPASARLDGAVNVQVQDVCPAAQLTHGDLPVSPIVVGLVLRAVDVADIRAPTTSYCTALQAADG